jgi:prophage antirepressor-like protein
MIARNALSGWDGECLHTDGGEFVIRYIFLQENKPYFMANDICSAVGAKFPGKGATRMGGQILLTHQGQSYFSAAAVEAYLVQRAVLNHEANRLLVSLKNEVFRKMNKLEEQRINRAAE